MMNKRQAALFALMSVLSLLFCLRWIAADVLPAKTKSAPKPEVPYEETLEPGTPVFERIVSINPVLSVSFETSSSPFAFFCECRTESGENVFVHIAVNDYKAYFDPDLPLNFTFVDLSPQFLVETRTLHGIVRKTSDYHSTSETFNAHLLDTTVTTPTYLDVTAVDDEIAALPISC